MYSSLAVRTRSVDSFVQPLYRKEMFWNLVGTSKPQPLQIALNTPTKTVP